MKYLLYAAFFGALFSLTSPASAKSNRPLAKGFSQFHLQTAGHPYDYRRVKFPDGRRVERFELRSGDCPISTNDCNKDRERVEFSEGNPGFRMGKEYWVAWSVYLPADFPLTSPLRTKVGQFHQKGTSGPELLFHLSDKHLILHLANPNELDDDPMNPIEPFIWKPVHSRNAMLGSWTRIMVNSKWTRSKDGFVRVFVNGKQVLDYTGPTTNDANNPVYFKYGIYRSFIRKYGSKNPPTLVAYYRDIIRGKTREAVEGFKRK